jgi:hypothetical protein
VIRHKAVVEILLAVANAVAIHLNLAIVMIPYGLV